MVADSRIDLSQCKDLCAEMRESLRSNELVAAGVPIRDEKTGELLVFGKRASDQEMFRSCRYNAGKELLCQGRFYRVKDGADPEPVSQAYCDDLPSYISYKLVGRARDQHHLKEPNTRPDEINYLPLTNALFEVPGWEFIITWPLYIAPAAVTLSLDVPLAAGQAVYRGADYLRRSRFQFRRYRFTKQDGEATQKLNRVMGDTGPAEQYRVQYNTKEVKHPRFMDLLRAVSSEPPAISRSQ